MRKAIRVLNPNYRGYADPQKDKFILCEDGWVELPEELKVSKTIIVDETDPRFHLKWASGKGLIDERRED